MTLKGKYPDSKLVHFIEMYDNIITLEGHALNALIFEDKEYINTILKEIQHLKLNGELNLILSFMKLSGWTNENEISVDSITTELESVLKLN